ncbi:hypothetical protein EIP91_010007 [Steccherinum ochraceum]|uniref:BTB domain-containing protein n=1 Tax=Steccherinum ochraceum TaxID=92696 RepID=A0A4R0RNQ5_9APHY|nr:hypothetical protein EIP91_010007 [Steccherinum ochraceum]
MALTTFISLGDGAKLMYQSRRRVVVAGQLRSKPPSHAVRNSSLYHSRADLRLPLSNLRAINFIFLSGMDSATSKKRKLADRGQDSVDGDASNNQEGSGSGANRPAFEHGKFWFKDGNVVLVAEKIGFRVYQGILAEYSDVFRDMFTMPQPADSEMVDQCPVVRLSDTASDLECILHALYDGASRYASGAEVLSFADVSAMINLGFKYQIAYIRDEAIRRLRICFPDKLDDVQLAFGYDADGWFDFKETLPVSLEVQDAVAVVNLCHKYSLDFLLPAAFYCCAQLSNKALADVIQQDDPERELSKADTVRLLDGVDQLKKAVLRTSRWLSDERIVQLENFQGPCCCQE